MVGITRSLHRRTRRLIPLAGLAALLTAGAAISQEGGGILLTFGIDQRLSWEDNPELDIPSTGDRFRSDTRLSFGFLSETARDRLSFNLGTVLRGEDDGGGFDFGLTSPSADLAYTRSGYSSSFTLSGFLRETDLGEGLSLVEGGEGELPILVFEDGTARTKGVRLAYTWGEGMPLGGSLRAGLTDTDYRDTTDPDLVDNRTTTVGAGLRFALNEVTDATLDLDHRRYDEDGPAAAEDSTTLSAGLVRALPRGSLRGKLSTTRDEDGTRTGLSFGRTIDLPRGSLSLDLGLTEAAGSGTDMTGALDWRQEMAKGVFSARLSRAVTSSTDNDETLVTALSLGLTQELTPRLGLNLGATWAQSEEQDTGLVTDNTSLSASFNYALTEDWAMNFGATHKVKDEDGLGRADSSSVFLSIGRTFEWRP
jgi:hypothetical protein